MVFVVCGPISRYLNDIVVGGAGFCCLSQMFQPKLPRLIDKNQAEREEHL